MTTTNRITSKPRRTTTTRKPRTRRTPPAPVVEPLTVTIPANHTPASLVGIARWCRENPNGKLIVRGWAGSEFTSESWLAWFRDRLDKKITASDPRRPTGRKSKYEYEIELYRLKPHVGTRLMLPSLRVASVLGPRIAAVMVDKIRDPNDY